MYICPIVKAIEVHNRLTGLIAEKTIINVADGLNQFDAMWISCLCDSTVCGKPDIELVDMTSRVQTIDEVMNVTTKSIIIGVDTGDLTEHFVYSVKNWNAWGR